MVERHDRSCNAPLACSTDRVTLPTSGAATAQTPASFARLGRSVFAFDATTSTPERVANGLEPAAASRLVSFDSAFAALDAIPPSYLIHAGYSLPFSSATELTHVWSLIRTALRPGGVFVGQLVGVRDSWASNPERART